ncbi:F0F1 ATP synthase subunit A [Actinomyces sp. F1_1611]
MEKPKRRYPLWWWVGLVAIVVIIALTAIPGFWETGRAPGNSIHSPGMGDFFPETLIWDETAFEFNRLTLARLLVAVVLSAILVTVALRAKLVPGRGQATVEFLAEFVRKNIGIELLGHERGRKYAVALGTIFFGVLGMNLTGVIPGINIAASSVMSVPLVFAVFAYVTFIGAGIKARGGLRFFKEQLFPPGVPWPVYILITPIELFSTFVVRPATLAVRLLSNMIAGHMLLAITYFGTQSMVVAAGGMKPLAILTFSGSVVLTLFELFVAALQAYVFTILTAVYIKMSVEAH